MNGDGKVNHNAPVLDCSPGNKDKRWHIQGALDSLEKEGVDMNKINLGLATYGRSFKFGGGSDSRPGYGKATGGGDQGECTLTPGVQSWYEIKRGLEASGQSPTIDPNQMAAYAVINGDWIGFDNQESHRLKICYGRSRSIGGLMVWDADMDDDLELVKAMRDSMGDDCDSYEPPQDC